MLLIGCPIEKIVYIAMTTLADSNGSLTWTQNWKRKKSIDKLYHIASYSYRVYLSFEPSRRLVPIAFPNRRSRYLGMPFYFALITSIYQLTFCAEL